MINDKELFVVAGANSKEYAEPASWWLILQYLIYCKITCLLVMSDDWVQRCQHIGHSLQLDRTEGELFALQKAIFLIWMLREGDNHIISPSFYRSIMRTLNQYLVFLADRTAGKINSFYAYMLYAWVVTSINLILSSWLIMISS